MRIEQIIEFESRGSGPFDQLWPYMYSYNWLFLWQNNNLSGRSSSGLFDHLLLKYCGYIGNVRYFPYLSQTTYKI